jgi:aldose 1-epimerase
MRFLWIGISLFSSSLASAQVRQDAPGIKEYTLSNSRGVKVRFLDLGGIITSIETPDRAGWFDNIVLGYGSTSEYRTKNAKNNLGAVIGRYAGRIAGARFSIGKREFQLNANDGPNALHGGGEGFERMRWKVRPFRGRSFAGARLQLVSADGAQGFPGRLDVTVTYRLFSDNRFQIDYEARTTRATHVNVTNHTYFDLGGSSTVTVADQRLRIAAHRWIESDGAGIPTGRLAPVAGTPLDFLKERAIGDRWDTKSSMMSSRGGYNHAWAFEHGTTSKPREVAWLRDHRSGRTLSVATTEPSVQVYTGDYIDGKDIDAAGRLILPRAGVALETQHYSDSPNQPGFPSTLLRPGQTFKSTTIWRFGVEPGSAEIAN